MSRGTMARLLAPLIAGILFTGKKKRRKKRGGKGGKDEQSRAGRAE